MSDEQDKLKASLEPPRLFGRKKKSGAKGSAKPAGPTAREDTKKPEPTSETPETPEDAQVDEDAEVAVPTAEPVVEAEEAETAETAASATTTEPDEEAEETGPEPDADAPPADDAAPEPAVDDEAEAAVPDTDDTRVIEHDPAPEPEDTQVLDDEPAVESSPVTEATAVLETDDDTDDETDEAPAGPEPPAQPSVGSRLADRVRSRWGPKPPPAADEEPAEPATPAHGQIEVEPEPVNETEAEDADIAARGTAYTAPMLDHYPAAALTGALVGLAMVVLTWLSLRGCEAIRGTATCGGGPGLLLLLAVFIVSVMLGNAILKSFLVPDPGSSSFLAVGLVAVVALLLLIDALDSWVMLIAIPLISIAAYLLSVYVTKTFVEPADDK